MSRALPAWSLPLAVAAYSAWRSADLVGAWRHSPFDRWGWVSFLVWLLPPLWAAWKCPTPEDPPLWPTALAFVLAVAGQVVDFNTLCYLGLAVALGSFVPASAARLVWWAGAPAWMPAFGWLLHSWPPPAVAGARLALALAVTAPCLLHLRRSCRT